MNKENNQTLQQFFAVSNLVGLFGEVLTFTRQAEDDGSLWYVVKTQPEGALVDIRVDVDGTTEIYIP